MSQHINQTVLWKGVWKAWPFVLVLWSLLSFSKGGTLLPCCSYLDTSWSWIQARNACGLHLRGCQLLNGTVETVETELHVTILCVDWLNCRLEYLSVKVIQLHWFLEKQEWGMKKLSQSKAPLCKYRGVKEQHKNIVFDYFISIADRLHNI